jgi:hypothetical protein
MRNAGGYDIHFAEDGCSRTNGFLGVYFTDATAKGRTQALRVGHEAQRNGRTIECVVRACRRG